MIIGAQFYTIRDFCKDLPSLSESLKKVSDIGYTTVQISGTCAYEPGWLKQELDKNGLKCVITHTARDKILADPALVCAEHKQFDCACVGLGMFPLNEQTPDNTYARFLELFKPAARAIRDNGCYFMYHNHDQEFRHINGRTILRQMAEDFAPDEMGFTLDTFWIQAGGGDPAQYMEELSGRIPCIHLKDFSYGRKMAVVGEGNINFDRVLAAAVKSGAQYALVEQDDCNGEDPFDCLKRSYENLRAMGLK